MEKTNRYTPLKFYADLTEQQFSTIEKNNDTFYSVTGKGLYKGSKLIANVSGMTKEQIDQRIQNSCGNLINVTPLSNGNVLLEVKGNAFEVQAANSTPVDPSSIQIVSKGKSTLGLTEEIMNVLYPEIIKVFDSVDNSFNTKVSEYFPDCKIMKSRNVIYIYTGRFYGESEKIQIKSSSFKDRYDSIAIDSTSTDEDGNITTYKFIGYANDIEFLEMFDDVNEAAYLTNQVTSTGTSVMNLPITSWSTEEEMLAYLQENYNVEMLPSYYYGCNYYSIEPLEYSQSISPVTTTII